MGWAVGAKTKLTLMDRKHKVFYQYQDIQADSLFSPMGQDDFQSRASHLKGHIVAIVLGRSGFPDRVREAHLPPRPRAFRTRV